MSFILDALKKSESDRQRQNGPALFEVRVAPPRTRLPTWAIAIALLLVVNFGIVTWILLRHQGHAGAQTATTGAPSAAAPAATSAPSAVGGAATSVPVVQTSAPGGAATPPALAGSASAAPGPAASTAPTANTPAMPAAGAGQGSASGAAGSSSPEDYTPAEETSPTGLGSHVRRGTASGMPLYQDVSSTPGAQLPQLRLDLHVFAARPENRFVMINMHKLREGDSLPEGVHVDSITPEGVVLTYNGSKFLLPRD